MSRPRIAIPVPTSSDPEYNERSWPRYASAVERSGGEAVAVPLDDVAAAAEVATRCDGVLLPGSGGDLDPAQFHQPRDPHTADPDLQREAVDRLLLETAERERKPVLAICFGSQMLNVWRGGSLIQHLPEEPVLHRQRGAVEAHSVEIAADSLLAEAVGLRGENTGGPITIRVNSSHHQGTREPGAGLRVVARSTEDGVIEAVEGAGGEQFLLGVQWHPERTYEESAESRSIFDRFVAEASRQDGGRARSKGSSE